MTHTRSGTARHAAAHSGRVGVVPALSVAELAPLVGSASPRVEVAVRTVLKRHTAPQPRVLGASLAALIGMPHATDLSSQHTG